MNYQNAPYETLCGCVSVPMTAAECQLPREAQQSRIESLIRAGKRQRHVMVNCKRCGGTGLMLNKY